MHLYSGSINRLPISRTLFTQLIKGVSKFYSVSLVRCMRLINIDLGYQWLGSLTIHVWDRLLATNVLGSSLLTKIFQLRLTLTFPLRLLWLFKDQAEPVAASSAIVTAAAIVHEWKRWKRSRLCRLQIHVLHIQMLAQLGQSLLSCLVHEVRNSI